MNHIVLKDKHVNSMYTIEKLNSSAFVTENYWDFLLKTKEDIDKKLKGILNNEK